ncbi:hypothetical protein [Streptomyces sp. NBC_01006]|uniref:hypothetical protein n=1 Tax=Streptomyces sp. NBC_01006 TaxID=2903716 RepID=UPI0038651B16|nr:hypothetical protein OG509_06430 [Streptomyces sp. NBC_01006]
MVLARGGRHTAGLTTGSLLVGSARLAHQADRALDRVAAATPEDEEQLLLEYLRCFGHLVYSLDPAEPTAIDDPSMLRSVIAGRRDGGEPSALTPASSHDGAPAGRLERGPVGRLRRGVRLWRTTGAEYWTRPCTPSRSAGRSCEPDISHSADDWYSPTCSTSTMTCST